MDAYRPLRALSSVATRYVLPVAPAVTLEGILHKYKNMSKIVLFDMIILILINKQK